MDLRKPRQKEEKASIHVNLAGHLLGVRGKKDITECPGVNQDQNGR